MEQIKIDQKKLDSEYKKLREEIELYFDESRDSKVLVDDGKEKILQASTYKNVSINYSLDLIKEKFDRKTFKLLVDTDYKIKMDILKELMKKGIIEKSIAKKFIESEYTINKDKIDSQYDAGNIDIKSLKECIESTKIVNNIKISRIKRELDE